PLWRVTIIAALQKTQTSVVLLHVLFGVVLGVAAGLVTPFQFLDAQRAADLGRVDRLLFSGRVVWSFAPRPVSPGRGGEGRQTSCPGQISGRSLLLRPDVLDLDLAELRPDAERRRLGPRLARAHRLAVDLVLDLVVADDDLEGVPLALLDLLQL